MINIERFNEDEEDKISSLITELEDNRKALHGMIDIVINFRNKIDTLLPKNIDFKNRFVMEEKMKTVTQIISNELSIRKQIDDSIKTEADLLKKIVDGGDDSVENKKEHIRDLAKAMQIVKLKDDVVLENTDDFFDENEVIKPNSNEEKFKEN